MCSWGGGCVRSVATKSGVTSVQRWQSWAWKVKEESTWRRQDGSSQWGEQNVQICRSRWARPHWRMSRWSVWLGLGRLGGMLKEAWWVGYGTQLLRFKSWLHHFIARYLLGALGSYLWHEGTNLIWFARTWCLACMLSHFSCVWLFATPWTVACQAPLSMGFSRQECWSLVPGDLLNPGIKPASLVSPALAGRCFTTSATWKAQLLGNDCQLLRFMLCYLHVYYMDCFIGSTPLWYWKRHGISLALIKTDLPACCLQPLLNALSSTAKASFSDNNS